MADIIAQPVRKKGLWHARDALFSSPERTRTSNLAVNSRPLCQLSYQGKQNPIIWNIIGRVKQNRPTSFRRHFYKYMLMAITREIMMLRKSQDPVKR